MQNKCFFKKRKGTLTHITAWMNHEDSMLNEMRQAQKDNTVQSHVMSMQSLSKLWR